MHTGLAYQSVSYQGWVYWLKVYWYLLSNSQNAINGYSQTAESNRFSFYGNVTVGEDISLTDILSAYHAVVLVRF